MNNFVILFRRRSATLSDHDRQRLNGETAAWAKTHNSAGHQLDPRILGVECAFRGPESATLQAEAWTLSAILFLAARDLNEAAQIAELHPGTRYGFNIEVRPWAKPAPAAA